MQNEKLIQPFKNKNKETNETNQLKDENKYEESTTIQIQRLAKIISTILIQRLGESTAKLQILSKIKHHEDIASKLYLS